MKQEYDFSKGERGKFYRPDAELDVAVYLDSDVRREKHAAFEALANSGVAPEKDDE